MARAEPALNSAHLTFLSSKRGSSSPHERSQERWCLNVIDPGHENTLKNFVENGKWGNNGLVFLHSCSKLPIQLF